MPTGACSPGTEACGALPPCVYGSDTCTCAAGATPGGGTWACGACPATQPTGACTTNGLECGYNGTECTCHMLGNAGTWTCVTPPPACPSTQPTAGDTCTAGTGGVTGCTYGTTTCVCLGAGAGKGDEWSCN